MSNAGVMHGAVGRLCRWQFQPSSVLASGSFGSVVRVQHRFLGKEYVIKRSATAITEEGIRRAWCQVRQGRQAVPSPVNMCAATPKLEYKH